MHAPLKISITDAGVGSKSTDACRGTTKKGAKTPTTTANADDSPSSVNAASAAVNSADDQQSLQLGDVEKLPPADAPEASGISAARYVH